MSAARRARPKDVVVAEILPLEKRNIEDRLDGYAYPVLTLPNEITSEIFLHFLPAYSGCPPPTGLLSPTLLTHICRKWRRIAILTPALWRAVSPCSQRHSRKEILDLWLARSRSCPLSLTISDYPANGEDVVQPLLLHRLRWEYLELRIGSEILHIFDGPAPLLRELHLRLIASPGSSPLVSLKEAGLLRTVTLNHVAAANIILPWTHLASLTLHNVFPHECTPILSQTGGLVHCKLYLAGFSQDPIQPDVNLPFLESLVFICADVHEVAGYLGTFVLPTLRRLEIPEMYLGPDPIPVLTAFVSKSGCKLQEVYITGQRSTSRALYRNTLPLVSKLSFKSAESVSEGDGDEESSDE